MQVPVEKTGRDETLAMSFYTGEVLALPYVQPAQFEYTIRRESLLEKVTSRFAKDLARDVSPEHLALLDCGEQQSPEDVALAVRVQDTHRKALTS